MSETGGAETEDAAADSAKVDGAEFHSAEFDGAESDGRGVDGRGADGREVDGVDVDAAVAEAVRTADADAAEADWTMPGSVRTAQVVALGMALIGLVCTGAAGWLSGGRAALITSLSFIPTWLLGLTALGFGAVGAGIRVGAILLAGLAMLWTVPSIAIGRPPGWLGPVGSVIVIVLLFRRAARDWFEPGGA
ncbi:hypothetical protein [Nocardia sp. BMG51109]|uniref:hypothetical protein n=1 Tax=Nocardia sp. BMG51109 TaxID=1056816 RepID=UPI0004B2EC9C|nr:hypothetical protein [Nocardia sp. BMG51109]